jgi:Tfp pilus assembly protein PilX
MSRRSETQRSERGMVLMSALAILLGLLLVGLGAGTMLQNDLRISGHLRASAEAFYHASAGLEWGKREIARAENFPPILSDRETAFSSGAFAVSFQSPTLVGPLGAQVVVRSVGTSATAKHLIQAQITKSYDLADAALVLRGNATRIGVNSSDFVISGANHDESGNLVTNTLARSAVSVGDASLRGLVSQAVALRPAMLDQNSGTEVVSQSDYLPEEFIGQFATDLCASPSALTQSIPAGDSLVVENQVWGTQSAPQLHCIEGGAVPGDAVTLAGTVSGAGILVVRNSDLILSEAFRWEGLIIVTGADISFKSVGTSPQQILGAVLLHETGVPAMDRKILDVEGALRLNFSRATLNRTLHLLPAAVVGGSSRFLPPVTVQNYWRADTW